MKRTSWVCDVATWRVAVVSFSLVFVSCGLDGEADGDAEVGGETSTSDTGDASERGQDEASSSDDAHEDSGTGMDSSDDTDDGRSDADSSSDGGPDCNLGELECPDGSCQPDAGRFACCGHFGQCEDVDPGSQAPCDPYAQDCPEGEKCSVALGEQGWVGLTNVCVTVYDSGQHGDACTDSKDPFEDAFLDSCAEGLFCWGTTGEGSRVGVCVPFCANESEDPMCPEATTCMVLGTEPALPLCNWPCDPEDPAACAGLPLTSCQPWGTQGDEFFCSEAPAP